jgi:Amt family ammonium transporter
VLFSFSLIYGKDAGTNGILSYPKSFYMFSNTIGETAEHNGADTIPNNIFAVFELGFALVTPTIIACSLHGRTGLPGFLFFIFAWHLTVYCPIAHAVWNLNGALYTNYVTDFAGGMVVHMLASATALSLHLVLGKDTIPKPGPVADPEKALYLALVVWFLWFGFNSGKSHDASQIAAQSIVNTIAAGFISVLTAFFYNLIFEKQTTSVTIVYALLIGLIAITPASGYVTIGGAMCIALSTYLVTAYVSNFITGEGVNKDEPFSVLTIHSVAGTMGFVWTAIISYKFVNPDANNGLTRGRGVPLGYHLAAMCAMWGCTVLATFILAFICNLIVPMGETGTEYAYKAGTPGNEAERAEPFPTSGADDVAKDKEAGLELTSV